MVQFVLLVGEKFISKKNKLCWENIVEKFFFWVVKNSKTDVTKICYTLHTYVHMYPIQWPGHDITVPPWSKFMHIKQNIQKCILCYVYPKSI